MSDERILGAPKMTRRFEFLYWLAHKLGLEKKKTYPIVRMTWDRHTQRIALALVNCDDQVVGMTLLNETAMVLMMKDLEQAVGTMKMVKRA
jgi:hypothetical protein